MEKGVKYIVPFVFGIAQAWPSSVGRVEVIDRQAVDSGENVARDVVSPAGGKGKVMQIPERKIEHIWQDFRFRCLRLAVDAGGGSMCIELSKKIESYILTKSEIEAEQVQAEKKSDE